MANLIEITKQDGSVLKSTLTQARTRVNLMPGDTIRVVDAATGKTPAGVKVRKIGDNLLVEGLEDGKAVEVSDFYTTKGAQVSLQDAAGSTSTVSTATPVDAGGVVYGADTGVATAAAQAGAGAAAPAAQTGAAASTVPTWAYVAGGALLIGAAAGGGGGGGSSGGTSTPKPVTAPTVTLADASDTGTKGDKVTNLSAPTITGTADANAKITVSYTDTTGAARTATATADASGKWSAVLSGIKEGASSVSVVASDGTTNSATTSYDFTRDSTVAAPTIALDPASDSGAKGDNITNIVKPTVGGTAEAGATVTVAYIDATGAQRSQTTTAGADGKWSVALANNLTVSAINTIEATATDPAGNTSAKGALAVTIQNSLTTLPTAAVVADADGITATNGVTTDRTPTLAGTAGGGATSVSVTYADAAGVSHTETAAVTNGNWTLTPAFKLALGSATAVQVTSTDGTLNSQPVAVNVTVNPNNAFTASADTVIGGAGAKTIFGGGGDDVLVGGAAGHVRASTFEYWNTSAAGSFVDVGNYDYTIFGAGAQLGGWSVSTPAGADADGRVSAAQAVYLRADYPAAPATVVAGDGNHWVFEGSSGDGKGVSMSQTVDLAVGRTYDMAIRLSNPATLGTFTSNAATSDEQTIEVRWNNTVVARYDADSGWDVIAGATFTPDGGGSSRGTLTITGLAGTGGDADNTTGTITISTYNPAASATPNVYGVRVDSVSLTANGAADGDNILVGGAGNDTITGGTGNDTMWGGNWLDTSTTTRSGESNTFVFSMKYANGNDVIKDFHLGVDKLVIADVLDTYNTGTATQGGTWAATGAGQDVTRLPGATTDGTTVANSDYNLSYRDVLAGGAVLQDIAVSNSNGWVKLTFTDASGAARGSVTLEGVAYGASTDTVAELMGGGGYNDPTINAGAATPVLYLTGDGFHAQIAQNVV